MFVFIDLLIYLYISLETVFVIFMDVFIYLLIPFFPSFFISLFVFDLFKLLIIIYCFM